MGGREGGREGERERERVKLTQLCITLYGFACESLTLL